MSTVIILVLLGIAVFVLYTWLHDRKSNESPEKNTPEQQLRIENVAPGAVVCLTRIGDELDDMDVEIIGRHVYREEGFEWFELEGQSPKGKVWIEVEDDDELDISISMQQLKLSDLGLEPKQIDAIEQRDEGTIEYAGISYEYEDWGKAQFLRNGDASKSEELKYWDFESKDDKHFLAIERWGEHEYLIYLSESISPAQINVYSLGEVFNASN